ncbi:MAG: STAS domain-containing protein [Candidatus Omnitrophica bacterium]|nr:STAS domain-containing protein [Candidatus Omnitrophota bacterium]
MKIESKLIDDVAVLTLIGELDSRGQQLLDKTLKELIDRQIFKVILDLSVIRFLGQRTISLLISNLKELRANGGDIRFLTPQRALLQYLKQNRVIELFQIFATRAEALDSYKSSGFSAIASKSPPSIRADAVAYSFASTPPSSHSKEKETTESSRASHFETGEILYANSCMLATLIKMLENKGMLSSQEASDLMDYERLSLKGVDE